MLQQGPHPGGLPTDAAGRRQAAELRGHRRTHGALHLGRPQSGFPAGACRAAAAGDLCCPAHYLKQFHAQISRPRQSSKSWSRPSKVQELGGSCTSSSARQYRPENPDLPTLEPWVNTTAPPAERFVFERNPYFHRVDTRRPAAALYRPVRAQHQLDRSSSRPRPAPAKATCRRAISTSTTTHSSRRPSSATPIDVLLWERTQGSQVALFPNLNYRGPAWRDAASRRALPPRAVARHRPARDQQGGLLRARPGKRRHDAAAEPAVPGARICRRPGRNFDPAAGQRAARRDRPRQARLRRHPPAARRPAGGDRRRDRRRKHAGDRRARTDRATIGSEIGIKLFSHALAARRVPQPRRLPAR